MKSIELWLDWILNNFFLITLAVLAITAIFMELYFGLIKPKKNGENKKFNIKGADMNKILKFSTVGAIGIFIAILFFINCYSVNTGEVAIVSTFGKITRVDEEGLLPDGSRQQAYGFGRSTAQKAVWRNKKAVANSAEKSIIKTIIKSVKFPDNCNYLLKIRN